MTKPKDASLAERAARGEYDLVVPLDYRLLDELPDDGTMLAGLYEIGVSSKEISKKYPALRSSVVATRLRLLAEQGLVKKVRLVGGGHNSGHNTWQRTKNGAKILAAWKGEQNVDG